MFKFLISKNIGKLKSKNILRISTYSTYIDDAILTNTLTYTDKKKSWAITVSPVHVPGETIGDLIEKSSKTRPNEICYTFPHNKGFNLTYKELENRVSLMASNFLALGFQKGDRIAFLLPNTSELAISMLAAASIGLVSVLLNPAYQLVEIEYMLQKVECKGIILYDSFRILKHLDILKTIVPNLDNFLPGELKSSKLPFLKHVIVINNPWDKQNKAYKGTWDYNKIAENNLSNKSYEKPYVEQDDPAFILFTSGTTGFPKGAVIKHKGILTSCNFFNLLPFGKQGWGTRCIPIPLFHVFGLGTGLICPLFVPERVIFPFYFPDTKQNMKAISEYKCQSLMGPPTIMIDLLNHNERKDYDLSSLKKIIMGASTVPYDLVLKLKDDLQANYVIIGYGMTETSMGEAFTTCNDDSKSVKHAYKSIGRPFPNTEIKIIDSNEKLVDLGVDGELCIRGPNIIPGYYNDPEKTAKTIDKNGWLKTGDICHVDEEGYLYFQSRSKDIIIRGGANIYPAEVESFLRTHPSVVDANVIGVPDERVGEEVLAWFKLKPGTNITIEDVKEFCKGKIAHFKVPRYIKVVENFPTNPNGKVLKNKILEMAKKDLNIK